MFFDFLRFSPEAQFKDTKAIMEIFDKYGDYNMSFAGPLASEMRNVPAVIIFSEKYHKVPYKHNRLLYVTVVVNGVEFKCAFLDGGASTSAMPCSVFKAARIQEHIMVRQPIEVNVFGES